MDFKLPKIFIDGGVPAETRQANEMMLKAFGRPLDGQTTNPTLIAKNLVEARKGKISREDALEEYKIIVREISEIIPEGSVSIQVFADKNTSAEDMLEQARARSKWIANASIKFPCTPEGLNAANTACGEMPVNITLVFSQEQAAAVYTATLNPKYPIFISPFVGRLDDKGENGMEVVKNIKEMYKNGDGHVEVLTASVRSIEHILYAIFLSSDIVTVPFKVFKLWADNNFPQPGGNYVYRADKLTPILYRSETDLNRDFGKYDLSHELTEKGVRQFWADWTGILS